MDMGFDFNEMLRRLVRYLVQGLGVAVASLYLLKGHTKMETIVALAVTSAALFAVLDLTLPSAGAGARLGSGLAMGGALAGGF